jgi:hypothetical protein
MNAEAAQAQAVELQDAAREHKRAASYHKRALHRTMASFTELQRACALAGIPLRIQTNTHEVPLGGQGDHRHTDGHKDDHIPGG